MYSPPWFVPTLAFINFICKFFGLGHSVLEAFGRASSSPGGSSPSKELGSTTWLDYKLELEVDFGDVRSLDVGSHHDISAV